jgi:hypothetical protein
MTRLEGIHQTLGGHLNMKHLLLSAIATLLFAVCMSNANSSDEAPSTADDIEDEGRTFPVPARTQISGIEGGVNVVDGSANGYIKVIVIDVTIRAPVCEWTVPIQGVPVDVQSGPPDLALAVTFPVQNMDVKLEKNCSRAHVKDHDLSLAPDAIEGQQLTIGFSADQLYILHDDRWTAVARRRPDPRHEYGWSTWE